MKKIITICLILLSMTAIAQNLKNNVTIYQDGKEFEVKGDTIPIELKNKSFSIRFNVEKDNPTALLAFIADKEGFLYVGNRGKDEFFHCFSPGTHKATVRGEKPKTFLLNDSEMGFRNNYYLYDFYLKDLPSDDKSLLRKELVISSVEGVAMKEFFLENLYLVLYPESGHEKIDKNLMTKITLRFLGFKALKTYPEDRFDLKNLNFKTFNAASFYKEAIAEGRVSRDSLTVRGFQYNINVENEEDKEPIINYSKKLKFGNTITYDQLTFPSMRVLTTSKGELMAVFVEDYRNGIPALQHFSAYLNTISKKGRDLNFASEWRDEAKIIQLTLEKIERFEVEEQSETSRVITKILIANPKFEKQLQKIRLRYFSIE